MPSISEADLRRLETERTEADRRYNDALTRLDAALVREPVLPALPSSPDEGSLTRIAERWHILPDAPSVKAGGLRARLGRFVRGLVVPIFNRQQQFNTAVLEHLTQQAAGNRQRHEALTQSLTAFREQAAALAAFQSKLIQYAQQITPYVDTKNRALAADLLRDPHEQVRALESTIGLLQQQVAVIKREMERTVTSDVQGPNREPQTPNPDSPSSSVLDAYKYVGFEQEFRGAPEEIRARLAAYCPYFERASDVLDVGCGRGEFLELLRDRGISGRGLELNHEMAEVCLARGLTVSEGDAVSYLAGLPDGTLGGLFAGQVVEHLEANYLLRFLELAYLKLRPGSTIILETINVDSWSAFFGPYLRDITHVRPLPPDTLMFLLRASGFQRVDMRASSPMGDEAKLTRLPIEVLDSASPAVARLAEAFNQNVDRLNGMLFGFGDYAAIGERL